MAAHQSLCAVLVAGGYFYGIFLASAELYDTTTGIWTQTSPMSAARAFFQTVLLPDGTGGTPDTLFGHDSLLSLASQLMNVCVLSAVLAAGGYDLNSVPLATAELYDPNTGTWTPTADMTVTRATFRMLLLANGKGGLPKKCPGECENLCVYWTSGRIQQSLLCTDVDSFCSPCRWRI